MHRLSSLRRLTRSYHLPSELLDELAAAAAARSMSVERLADELVVQTLPLIYAEAVSRRLTLNRGSADDAADYEPGDRSGGHPNAEPVAPPRRRGGLGR